MEWRDQEFRITDDVDEVDLDFVERMLNGSYWAADRSRDDIEASLKGSVPFSLFEGTRQIGFARAVTDGITFAWIADVIVDSGVRGRGLGTWLVECVLEHPRVGGAARQLLRTKDAHGLYERFAFERNDCMTRESP